MKKLKTLILLAFMSATTVAAFATSKLYMVIDLSAGANASTYPVSYLEDVPTGGWTDEYKTTKLVLRRIEAGSFIMGEDQTDESHRVTLTKPYYIGVFEMTQKQWTLVMGSNPSYFSNNDKRPVEFVKYDVIRGSCRGCENPKIPDVDEGSLVHRLRTRTGIYIDLPTESQWEYACRAGTITAYSYGDTANGDYMWYSANSGSSTHDVGTRKPNPWGLYDVHGNVWEWCLDRYDDSDEWSRVLRGGEWGRYGATCTSFERTSRYTWNRQNYYGLRIASSALPNTGGTITFDGNGSTNEIAAVGVSAGKTVDNLPVISRKGYVFLGWHTAKEGGELIYRGRALNGDMTAYAHWVKESQIENATDEKGGFVCVQYNSVFAHNALSDAMACVTNAAAWMNTPSAKRYKTIAMGADASTESSYESMPFPGLTDTGKQYSHFAVTVKGTVIIPEAGKWTFDCGHDDGFSTVINGNGVSFAFEHAEQTGYKHTTATFDFPVAGKYDVSLVYYQHTGGATFDFSVAKGAYSAFDASAFKLVGDPASGVEVVVAPDIPKFSPATGSTFEESLTISMSCAAKGATIHYTTNGLTPTAESPKYTRKFRIYGRTTVKAIAFYEDGTASEVAVAKYAKWRDDPVIRPADGTVFQHSGQVVSIRRKVEDGVVRYTTDGSEPTAESAVYAGAFTIDETTTVKAKVFGDQCFDSEVLTATLTREWVKLPAPEIAAAAEFTGTKNKVVLSCANEGATIRYTLDGSEPTASSPVYEKPFCVSGSCTVRAYAVMDDYLDSDVATLEIARAWCIGDTMGKPDHAFETGGDAGFVRVEDATAALGESMRSGEIKNSQTSILSTVVVGPGTLTFKWKTSCEEDEYHEWDHAEFAVDGEVKAVQDGETDWVEVSQRIAGDGEHAVTWTYVKDDVEFGGEDCLWVSEYAWATDYAETQTTGVPVPYGWLDEKCSDVVDEYESYEKVAKQTALNGRLTVEQCYVAGVDPESRTNDFKVVIGPDLKIDWDPNLKAARDYKVWGSTNLVNGGDWEWPTNALHRFFKVTVEMP